MWPEGKCFLLPLPLHLQPLLFVLFFQTITHLGRGVGVRGLELSRVLRNALLEQFLLRGIILDLCLHLLLQRRGCQSWVRLQDEMSVISVQTKKEQLVLERETSPSPTQMPMLQLEIGCRTLMWAFGCMGPENTLSVPLLFLFLFLERLSQGL